MVAIWEYRDVGEWTSYISYKNNKLRHQKIIMFDKATHIQTSVKFFLAMQNSD